MYLRKHQGVVAIRRRNYKCPDKKRPSTFPVFDFHFNISLVTECN